jgi:hypothetical protein
MEHLLVTEPEVTTPEAPTTALGAGPGFVVQLDAFNGPLDLLLHLLREERLEIADIPIARIADQFLQAIHELGLNQAADYLDMASRLVRSARSRCGWVAPPSGGRSSSAGDICRRRPRCRRRL